MIVFTLFLSVALRLIALNQSFWLDEAIGAIAAKNYSYAGIVTDFLKSDNHPPLYYLALKVWASIFGFSEISLRSLSVVFGVGSVYLVFLIAKKLKKETNFFPHFSAFLMATSPFFIYYSQEARMYAMAAFFASLAIYSFLFTLDKKTKGTKAYWLLFSLAIVALVFTDYVPVFLLPVFFVCGLVRKMDKRWWFNFFAAFLPLVILGIGWLPILKVQAESGRWLLATLPAWKRLAGGATFKQAVLVWMKFVLGRISFFNKNLYYLLVGLSSVPFVLALISAWRARKKLILIWLWFFLPLVLGFVVSFIFPAFIYFRFTFVVPAFYLLIGWGVSNIKNKRQRVFLGALILVVNVIGWLIYTNSPNQQREQWRQAVEFVEKKADPGKEVVIFEYPEAFAPYRWYAKGKVEAVGATDSISASYTKTFEKTKNIIKDKTGIYYFEYLKDLSDPEGAVKAALKENGFKEKEVFNFVGVGHVIYWQKQ